MCFYAYTQCLMPNFTASFTAGNHRGSPVKSPVKFHRATFSEKWHRSPRHLARASQCKRQRGMSLFAHSLPAAAHQFRTSLGSRCASRTGRPCRWHNGRLQNKEPHGVSFNDLGHVCQRPANFSQSSASSRKLQVNGRCGGHAGRWP